MAIIPLPYSDGIYDETTVFDIYCNGGFSKAIQGRSLGYSRGDGGGTGVVGTAEYGGVGVMGVGNDFDRGHSGGSGILGFSNVGTGVYGNSTDSYGLFGSSEKDTGIYGISYKAGSISIEGGPSFSGGTGVLGECDAAGGIGVHGLALGPSGVGLLGEAREVGIYAASPYIPLVAYNPKFDTWAHLAGPGPVAAELKGLVNVYGDVIASGYILKGGGGFRIDHPLAPADQFLCHSFVESPDMKNLYDGIVQLNRRGEATVSLPSWFSALNKDFRYQLTAIGSAGPGLHIAQDIKRNRFKIAGGRPGSKVSWQVTGIRKDPWAIANRIPVEKKKNTGQRGFYLHPDLYKKPAEKGLGWANHSKQMGALKTGAARLKQQRKLVTSMAAKLKGKLRKMERGRPKTT